MKTMHLEEKKERHFESENTDLSVANLCNGVGLLTCVCLIVYFFIMSSFNLQEVLLLRGVNFIFLSGAILLVLHLYSKATENKIDYFKGMKLGIWVTFNTVVPFALFIALYLAYDNHLMEIIKQSTSAGDYLNQLTIAFIIFIEGMSSGIIMTFIAMQYFKQE